MAVLIWLAIAIFAGLLLFLLRQDWRLFTRRRGHAIGTVIDHRRAVDDGHEYFHARIRFTDAAGKPVEFEDYATTASSRPPLGTAIDVVYALDAPAATARLRHLALRSLAYAFALFGLAVMTALAAGWLPR